MPKQKQDASKNCALCTSCVDKLFKFQEVTYQDGSTKQWTPREGKGNDLRSKINSQRDQKGTTAAKAFTMTTTAGKFSLGSEQEAAAFTALLDGKASIVPTEKNESWEERLARWEIERV